MNTNRNRKYYVLFCLLCIVLVGYLIFSFIVQGDDAEYGTSKSITELNDIANHPQKSVGFQKSAKLKNLLASKQIILKHGENVELALSDAPPKDGPEPNVVNLSPTEIAKRLIRNDAIKHVDFPSEVPPIFDSIIEQQLVDSHWTHNVENRLIEQLELSSDNSAELDEVKCYTTMCKIVTHHSSNDSANSFFREADGRNGIELQGPGHRFNTVEDENRVTSTFYMARYGKDEYVHDHLYNRLYEQHTGRKYEDIVPTPEQLQKISESRN